MKRGEKTLGQILWETSQCTAMCNWSELEESIKPDWEMRAQAVIDEFLRRNAEPVAWIDVELFADLRDMIPPKSSITAKNVRFKSSQEDMSDKPLFAAPQPRRKPVNPEAEFYPNDAFEE